MRENLASVIARRQMRDRGGQKRQKTQREQRDANGACRPDRQPRGQDHGENQDQEMRQRHVILRCLQYGPGGVAGKGPAAVLRMLLPMNRAGPGHRLRDLENVR